MKPQEVFKTISKLLDARLQPVFKNDDGSKKSIELNLVTCVEIYGRIFDTLVEVATESSMPITNEGMNYLAQQLYDGILVNGTQELDPEIFTQRANVENIETKELALLCVIMNGTDFALPLLEEIKKRS